MEQWNDGVMEFCTPALQRRNEQFTLKLMDGSPSQSHLGRCSSLGRVPPRLPAAEPQPLLRHRPARMRAARPAGRRPDRLSPSQTGTWLSIRLRLKRTWRNGDERGAIAELFKRGLPHLSFAEAGIRQKAEGSGCPLPSEVKSAAEPPDDQLRRRRKIRPTAPRPRSMRREGSGTPKTKLAGLIGSPIPPRNGVLKSANDPLAGSRNDGWVKTP